MLIRQEVKIPGLIHKVYRSAAGLWIPLFDAIVSKHRNVLAVLGTASGKTMIPASNIVTSAGDIFYAQKAVGEATANVFGVHIMASAGTPGKAATDDSFTQIAGSEKAHAAGYPKRNDTDPDNTGAGVDKVTYLASYAKADFNAVSITHGIVTNAAPGVAEPILTGYAFAAGFAKTADDTLKVFVNHQMLGS